MKSSGTIRTSSVERGGWSDSNEEPIFAPTGMSSTWLHNEGTPWEPAAAVHDFGWPRYSREQVALLVSAGVKWPQAETYYSEKSKEMIARPTRSLQRTAGGVLRAFVGSGRINRIHRSILPCATMLVRNQAGPVVC